MRKNIDCTSLLEQVVVGKRAVIRVSPPDAHLSGPGLTAAYFQVNSTPSCQALVAARPWVDGSITPKM